jgi:hypothetical protein
MTTNCLPINPCEGCDVSDNIKAINCIGRICRAQDKYQSNLEALETMLEHLPLFGIKQGHIEGIDCYCIPKSRISSMLVKIREAKG